MSRGTGRAPDIESFNLADLDVGALDTRLELTTLVPACTLIACEGNEGGSGGGCHTRCGTKCGNNVNGCVVDT